MYFSLKKRKNSLLCKDNMVLLTFKGSIHPQQSEFALFVVGAIGLGGRLVVSLTLIKINCISTYRVRGVLTPVSKTCLLLQPWGQSCQNFISGSVSHSTTHTFCVYFL
jgi:hypothetical protein